jgi:peptidoglycan/LPS O-acetylase OafA/YrhL
MQGENGTMGIAASHSNSLVRLSGIDALRGFSVLLVVLHHIHLRFVLNHYDVAALMPKPVGRVLFWSGYYAVIAFFVISGFLITSLSIRRWTALSQIDAKQFYLMRVARIVPCLLLLLLVLSCLHLMGASSFTIDASRASLGRALFAALTFHVNWLEGVRGYLPGSWDILWSLSVEETFYLFFPLLCLLLKSEKLVLLPIFALIVIGPFYRVSIAGQEPWEEYAYFACMDGIAFGSLAALISARLKPAKGILRIGLGIGVGLIVLVICFRDLVSAWQLPASGLNITVLEIGVALTLLAVANDVGNRSLARFTGWIQFVGRSSYEIYLTHMFVVLGVMQLYKTIAPATPLFPAWYAAMLLLSIALGYAVARFYSEPANAAVRQRAQRASIMAAQSVASP